MMDMVFAVRNVLVLCGGALLIKSESTDNLVKVFLSGLYEEFI
jgi:hypothetical protein